MGGLVAYIVGLKHSNLVDGVVLMNPAIAPSTASKYFGWAAKLLGKTFGTRQILPRIWGNGSKNPAVDDYLKGDELFYKEKIRPATTMNIVYAMELYG